MKKLMIGGILIALLLSGCGSGTIPPEPPADGSAVSDVEEAGVELPQETENPAAEAVSTGKTAEERVTISEVLPKGGASFRAACGDFADWIELYNEEADAVSLGGWTLTDTSRDMTFVFPETVIPAGDRMILVADACESTETELHLGYTLRDNSELVLRNAEGRECSRFLCPEDAASDTAYISENGIVKAARYTTPGAANDEAGYEMLQAGTNKPTGVFISEVMVENRTYDKQSEEGYCDWVELYNGSDRSVNLSDYHLSDDEEDLQKCRLPDLQVDPGCYVVIYCCDNSCGKAKHIDLSLNASHEKLFLSGSDGELIDYIPLHNIPLEGSFGRMIDRNGGFYFETPTPGNANENGRRFVSEKPEADISGGVYETEAMTISLQGKGTIYYTLDGSAPTVSGGTVYSEPISLKKTTVIRAISVEDDNSTASRILTEVYFINEDSTLPIVNLSTNNVSSFNRTYGTGEAAKGWQTAATFTYYDGDSAFQTDCGVELSGFTSLSAAKKSLDILFRGVWGSEAVEYDFFGSGTFKYKSLTLRAGQDYPLAFIRNELMQDLCLQMTDKVLTQHTKFCSVYVNGVYYGVFSLKEDLTTSYFAEYYGVKNDQVEVCKSPLSKTASATEDVSRFVNNHDMSDPENYREYCERVDIDSLIDWFILECYCNNTDVDPNIKYVRAEGGKWTFVFYDLDWSFKSNTNGFTRLLGENAQMNTIVSKLMENDEFKQAVITRYAELLGGTLSTENVLSTVNKYVEQIRPEMAKERARWGGTVQTWEKQVAKLCAYIEDGYELKTFRALCTSMKISDTERELLEKTFCG